MDFDTFVEKLKNDLDQFKRYWYRKNIENPELFPTIMDEGDWLEQFEFFNSHKEE